MPKASSKPDQPLTVVDEPGMAERFQRGLQRALNTPPKPRTKPPAKRKDPVASKGNAGRN